MKTMKALPLKIHHLLQIVYNFYLTSCTDQSAEEWNQPISPCGFTNLELSTLTSVEFKTSIGIREATAILSL